MQRQRDKGGLPTNNFSFQRHVAGNKLWIGTLDWYNIWIGIQAVKRPSYDHHYDRLMTDIRLTATDIQPSDD